VATGVTTSPKVRQELQDFFQHHGVKQVALSQGSLGCPHEEGEGQQVGQGQAPGMRAAVVQAADLAGAPRGAPARFMLH
jgi:hypothetical protein